MSSNLINPDPTELKPSPPPRPGLPPCAWALAVWTVILLVTFARPLFDWIRFARGDDLYSHIILIPFVSAYLVWVRREGMLSKFEPSRGIAIIPLLAGIGLFVTGRLWEGRADADYLAIMGWAFVLLFTAGVLFFLGGATAKYFAFPLFFLIFAAPFPEVLMNKVITWLQHGSADVAYWMLTLSGMPVLRQGTDFSLPGFNMNVAPQCSGIHATLVLFITSLVAGQLMLKTRWRRAVLVFAVVPVALLRNGLRIFTIGQLCVQISPEMIRSPIHTKGGPIFFALSLIPFLLILVLLRKSETRKNNNGKGDSTTVKV